MGFMDIASELRGIVAIILAAPLVGCVSTDLAPGVNPPAIKGIKLGMSIDSVIHLMGVPYAIKADIHHQHLIECPNPLPSMRFVPGDVASITPTIDSAFKSPESCCIGERDTRSRRFTMEYSRMSGPWDISPMVWVHFDEAHRVNQVYVSVNSRSAFREDEYVYMLSTDPMDSTAGYTTGNYDCNDELLVKYFFAD